MKYLFVIIAFLSFGNFSYAEDFIETESGLKYAIIETGEGNLPGRVDYLQVHYIGKLDDGTEFQNTYSENKPFSFPLTSVIPGWKEGLRLIKPGGKIKLIIPPKLAYGGLRQNKIPANSTVHFEIELLKIYPKKTQLAKPQEDE